MNENTGGRVCRHFYEGSAFPNPTRFNPKLARYDTPDLSLIVFY
jgi:hypothetical protein